MNHFTHFQGQVRSILLQTASLLLACASAWAAPPLVLLVSDGALMPLARIQEGRLVEGLIKEVDEALGRALERPVQHVVMSRNRILSALINGEADGICYANADWYGPALRWSIPFFHGTDLLITRQGSTPPKRLQDLSGQAIGTVYGYVYPALEHALGSHFVREDAPNSQSNLNKLAAGRMQHALVDSVHLAYYLKATQPALLLAQPPLRVTDFKVGCGFAPRSSISIEQVNQALTRLLETGQIERIVAHYK